jgi:hypothetical protein
MTTISMIAAMPRSVSGAIGDPATLGFGGAVPASGSLEAAGVDDCMVSLLLGLQASARA